MGKTLDLVEMMTDETFSHLETPSPSTLGVCHQLLKIKSEFPKSCHSFFFDREKKLIELELNQKAIVFPGNWFLFENLFEALADNQSFCCEISNNDAYQLLSTLSEDEEDLALILWAHRGCAGLILVNEENKRHCQELLKKFSQPEEDKFSKDDNFLEAA